MNFNVLQNLVLLLSFAVLPLIVMAQIIIRKVSFQTGKSSTVIQRTFVVNKPFIIH